MKRTFPLSYLKGVVVDWFAHIFVLMEVIFISIYHLF